MTGDWRVAVTRDEGPDGPLARALRAQRFEPMPCPVMFEGPPEAPEKLAEAAARLEDFDWVVCASVRAVRALVQARAAAWPAELRTAAVGRRTAEALTAAGVVQAPLVADDDGADALWSVLAGVQSWQNVRVLVPTTPGGRRTLIDGLVAAGARVEAVDAYRMCPREPSAIAADWADAAPDAAVLASPRVARALVESIGADALRRLRAVAAIGGTTAAALEALDIPCLVPDRADFVEAARLLADVRAHAEARA